MFLAHWPLLSMVFRWFLGHSTITIKWFSAPRPLLSMVFRWFGDLSTIGFNDFQWSWTIGPTMRWFRWIDGSIYQAIFNRAVFSISKVDSYQSSMLTTWIHLVWNIFWPRWPPPHRMAAAKGWGKKRNIIWAPPPFHGWTPSLMELRRGSWPLIGASRNGAPILRYTVLLC